MTNTELPTLYQSFIHKSRYARWLPDMRRRETWNETTQRYMNFMFEHQCAGKIPQETQQLLYDSMFGLETMPSMRGVMSAGPALMAHNVAGFNCSYVAVDDLQAFDEMLYVLMCGTGVGYSVERQFVNKLPTVANKLRPSKTVIKVEDSKIGWANSLRELISMLYQGRIPAWDVSAVRPSGSRLQTMGGRASGPEPLLDLFNFLIRVFKTAQGRKLNSMECHDICCKIGDIVVVGGVRRSALISLSNPSDDRMRHAKDGQWWETSPWRALANNSACYTEKPAMDTFMREWLALYESKSGERGIFNREAAAKQVAKYGRRDPDHEWGTNPCSEIILRSKQFCNLSEVVVRPEDDVESLVRKVTAATIFGTMQATLTDFKYLRPEWKDNTDEEALLGVSLTGILDNTMMSGREGKSQLKDVLHVLREHAVATNVEWAERLDIRPSASITCVKPSGTVSQLVDCSSGIHPRYSPFFTRNVRADKKDPLAQLMSKLGFPHEDESLKPDHMSVFSFPMRSPDCSIVSEQMNALEHLELWKTYQLHWCEHKPSITVYLREHEWLDAGSWVYKNFDIVSGIAFLPHSGHNFVQAPYEECTEEQYLELKAKMPTEVDWARLEDYEKEDTTQQAKEFACTGNKCELTDLGTTTA